MTRKNRGLEELQRTLIVKLLRGWYHKERLGEEASHNPPDLTTYEGEAAVFAFKL